MAPPEVMGSSRAHARQSDRLLNSVATLRFIDLDPQCPFSAFNLPFLLSLAVVTPLLGALGRGGTGTWVTYLEGCNHLSLGFSPQKRKGGLSSVGLGGCLLKTASRLGQWLGGQA